MKSCSRQGWVQVSRMSIGSRLHGLDEVPSAWLHLQTDKLSIVASGQPDITARSPEAGKASSSLSSKLTAWRGFPGAGTLRSQLCWCPSWAPRSHHPMKPHGLWKGHVSQRKAWCGHEKKQGRCRTDGDDRSRRLPSQPGVQPRRCHHPGPRHTGCFQRGTGYSGSNPTSSLSS